MPTPHLPQGDKYPSSNMKKLHAFILSAIITIIFLTVIIITADLYLPLKDFLKSAFYHHWIGKGILGVALFLISSFLINLIPYNIGEQKESKSLLALFFTAILSFLALTLFFLYEAFLKT